MKRRAQATRANPAQVDLHQTRQHKLGERMIGDNDKPRPWEFVSSAAVLALAIAALWLWR